MNKQDLVALCVRIGAIIIALNWLQYGIFFVHSRLQTGVPSAFLHFDTAFLVAVMSVIFLMYRYPGWIARAVVTEGKDDLVDVPSERPEFGTAIFAAVGLYVFVQGMIDLSHLVAYWAALGDDPATSQGQTYVIVGYGAQQTAGMVKAVVELVLGSVLFFGTSGVAGIREHFRNLGKE